MTISLSLSKKYTFEGKPVRLYSLDGCLGGQAHGAIQGNDGMWRSCAWDPNSFYLLIELKPKRRVVGWLNYYCPTINGSDALGFYDTREIADKYAGSDRIACIHIDVETEDLSAP